MTNDMFSDDFRFPAMPDPDPEGQPAPEQLEGDTDALPVAVDREWFNEHTRTPTWRQRGRECTGFALAAAVNYLIRSRGGRDAPSVSPRMMYEMAQEYDRAAYLSGSTMRGALIGWQRRGVTTEEQWPYHPDDEHGQVHGRVTVGRLNDARTRQLPSADYRSINVGDISAMKTALAEHKVLYVVAEIHTGWFRAYMPHPEHDDRNILLIDHAEGDASKGAHAFLIVGYNEDGFWVHNSWGPRWGEGGDALLSFRDWELHGKGVWALQIKDDDAATWPKPPAAQQAEVPVSREVQEATARRMWRHIVTLGDDGRLKPSGLYGSDDDMLKNLFYMFKQETSTWTKPRLLIYADDGSSALPRTIEELAPLRDRLMSEEIYPIFVVWDVPWHPDLDDELTLDDTFATAVDRKQVNIGTDESPELVDKSFWQYEYQVPQGLAVMMWRAIRDRARHAASLDDGGLKLLAERIRYRWNDKPFALHLVAHGVGDFGLSELASLLEVPVTSCELWGPATTIADFERTYGTMLDDGRLGQVTVTVLDDIAERADRIGNYEESILCLASNVLSVEGIDSPERFHYGPRSEAPASPADFEDAQWFHRVRRDPEPILGLHRFLSTSPQIASRADKVHIDTVGSTHLAMPRDLEILDTMITRVKHTTTVAPPSPPQHPTEGEPTEGQPTDFEPPRSRTPLDPLEAARLKFVDRQQHKP
jgi:hypothetical protein